MYLCFVVPLLLFVPYLLARRGSGSQWVWFGGGGLFLMVFVLGAMAGRFGGAEARVAEGVFHTITETLIGVRVWTFVGSMGFTLAGFCYKQEPEGHGLFGR